MNRKLLTILFFFTSITAVMPCASNAGANKTGGDYTVLMDAANARGGLSSGGDYSAFSSIGQRISGDSATGGDYTAVSGVMGAVDTTPPEIAITSPAAGVVASGTIMTTGTAKDHNGITWTLSVGPGADPADDDWMELASGSGNHAADYDFGALDSTYFSGIYTFRLAALDGHGNSSRLTVPVSIEYVYNIAGTYPEDEWVFTGIPVDSHATSPLEIFGTEAQYKIYRWDPGAAKDEYMDKYVYPESLSAGSGFWIKAFYNDINYSYTGSPALTNDNLVFSLAPGWNQVCAPYNTRFPWGAIQVAYDGGIHSLSEAELAGKIDPVMRAYDPETEDWVQRDEETIMQPREGFFVWAYDNIDLVFDPDNRVLSKIVRPAVDYKINISASTPGSGDMENYFGSASRAARGLDIYDSFEPPRPMGGMEGAYTRLYFKGSDTELNSGLISNDMRPLARKTGDTESWDFTVETNESGKDVTLEWDRASLPLNRFSFTLLDTASGKVTDMGAADSYSYVAAFGVSSAGFRIKAEKLAPKEESAALTIGPGWNLISIPLNILDTSAERQLGETLSRLQVVQYFDGDFYFPGKGEGVDFQGGIGYWFHSAQNIELKFSGQPVDIAAEIELPLEKGYNMIGSPFASGLTFGDNISVSSGEKMIPLGEAVNAGILEGKIYSYDTASGTYVPLETGGVMSPWKGYVIIAHEACAMLLRK